MNSTQRIRSFLLLAFGWSWAIAGVGALFGVSAASGVPYVGMAALCMLGPAFAAVVQHRSRDRAPWKDLGLAPSLIRWRWLWLTVLVGLSMMPLCLLVVHVLGDGLGYSGFGHVSVSGERFANYVQGALEQAGKAPSSSGLSQLLSGLPGVAIFLALLLSALFAAFSFNLPFMLGEELGWRGYLFQATAGWSTLRRVLFTGVVWGLWHAPLIAMGHNYPGYPIIGIGMMVVFCLLLAFLFDWSRTRVGSVWGPCVLHGIINGTAGSIVIFAWDGHILLGSPVGLGGFISIALLVVAVLLFDGRYRAQLFASR